MGFDVQRHNDVHPIQLAQKSTIPSSNLHFRNSDNVNITYMYVYFYVFIVRRTSSEQTDPSSLQIVMIVILSKATMRNFQGN